MKVYELLRGSEVYFVDVNGADGSKAYASDSNVSTARSATGNYTITISDVRFTAKAIKALVTSKTADTTVRVTGASQSGDTVTVTVNARTSDPTAAAAADADADFVAEIVLLRAAG